MPNVGHLAAHPTVERTDDRRTARTNMSRMLNIIRRMDQAGTQDVEVIRLENASAERRRADAELVESGAQASAARRRCK